MAHALARGLGPSAFSDGLCEPFAGGASLYFATRPSPALLGDINPSLIATYQALRDHPSELGEALSGLTIDVQTFAAMRSACPSDAVSRAARFIYLNRTAFGGLWRVNRRGEFNVPFGCKPGTRLPTRAELEETSRELASANLLCADFRAVLAESTARTVYFDPPYASATVERERFVRYSDRVFSWPDQIVLADIAAEMVRAGHRVLVSNGYARDILDLYDPTVFKAYRITRPTNFASSPVARGPAHELFLLGKNTRLQRVPAGFEPIRRRI